ncbi:MAG TPA: hypothetical protein VFC78_20360 [Tepidisphaeraceae bacterium]|nr:hypothetical protein [Tepidisphaeraceae bacterium]
MHDTIQNPRALASMLAMAAALLLLAGCGANHTPATRAAANDGPAASAISQQGGAQLWSANCSRCHNMRPPDSFSSAQWQAITMHMRLRANLTGPEQRKIAAFLGVKSSTNSE